MPTKEQFKPGPYRVEITGEWPETNHYYGIYNDVGTCQVAKVEGFGEEALATANLMAASDVLYFELEKAHHIIHTMLQELTQEQLFKLVKILDEGEGMVRTHMRDNALRKAKGLAPLD